MRERALFKCINCGLELTLITHGNLDCPHCGAGFYLVHKGGFHTMPRPQEEKPRKKPQFSESAIMAEFERGMRFIEERLAAEAELDKYSD